MGEGNRFCCLIPQITFELPGNRQFVLYKFWKVEFLLKLQEKIKPPPMYLRHL